MEVPDHNGVGYLRGPQGEAYRSRGQLQRHHTIQTCDDAYVSEGPAVFSSLIHNPSTVFALETAQIPRLQIRLTEMT